MNKTRLAAALSAALIAFSASAAQYEVTELAVNEFAVDTFASDINNAGQVTVNVTSPYNLPLDFSLIDFEAESLIALLTDIESAKAGNPNDADYQLLLNLIQQQNNNQFFQQLAATLAFSADTMQSEIIRGHDKSQGESSTYTLNTDTIVAAINDNGTTVGKGEGLFYKLPYTNVDGEELTYVLNDFYIRAFATVNGNSVELPPIETLVGGYSEAFDINNNNQVVGHGTVELSSDTFQTAVDECNDDTLRADVPVESCYRSLMTATSSNGISSFRVMESSFQRRGLIWQLDETGNILSTKQLGLLLTPEEDSTIRYTSRALAINDNGIAVGQASGYYQDTTSVRTFAAIFEGDTVSRITDDNAGYFNSSAIDINNNGLVAGFGQKTINGFTRSKLFVHDINTQTTTFPTDFFLGSASVPVSMNNNNQVVGYAEIDTTTTATRRVAGFIYDHNTQVFQNLNELLSCDSPYRIVQANGINDLGEIAATAVTTAPLRNQLGQVLLNDDGSEQTYQKVLSVKLSPLTGGSIEDCSNDDGSTRERQGASILWLTVLLFPLLFVRRRKTK